MLKRIANFFKKNKVHTYVEINEFGFKVGGGYVRCDECKYFKERGSYAMLPADYEERWVKDTPICTLKDKTIKHVVYEKAYCQEFYKARNLPIVL